MTNNYTSKLLQANGKSLRFLSKDSVIKANFRRKDNFAALCRIAWHAFIPHYLPLTIFTLESRQNISAELKCIIAINAANL